MRNKYFFNLAGVSFLSGRNKILTLKRAAFIVAGFIAFLSAISFNVHAAITPSSVNLYNFGDTTQLAFNNSIIYTSTPVFRVATFDGDNPTNFVIEINTQPTFTGGTDFLQTFTGSYITGTPYDLLFNNGFAPDSGSTYYVRVAASADSGNTYSAYSSITYSFTYLQGGSPEWYQTTQAQFLTDSLSGTIATSDSGVQVNPGNTGVNVFTNPSFETGSLSSWTTSVAPGANGINKTHFIGIETSSSTENINGVTFTAPVPTPVTNGTYCMVIANTADGFSESFASGSYVVAQTNINLTGISTITFSQTLSDWNQGGCPGFEESTSNLQVIIDASNTSTGTTGNVVYTSATLTGACGPQLVAVSTGPNTETITLPGGIYGSNCSVKFVWNSTIASSDFTDAPTVYIDNIQSSSATKSGTIISTPFVLSSVQHATNWSQLQWNQTLNGGTIMLDVQKCISGTWTDEGDITSATDGANSYNISFIPVTTPSDSIRVVATLTATDSISPSLNNWMISTNGSVTTGINESSKRTLPGFDAYPNPASYELKLDFPHVENTPGLIEIINSMGQAVYRSAVTARDMTISLKNLSEGIYLARFTNNNNAQSLKIVVRR